MSNTKFENIARLITTYRLEIDNKVLPDNLKCTLCKLVLKDACLVPCGCTFCRVCIDDLMVNGSEFCPGVSEDCGESLLSDFTTDYTTNKTISKLTVKCPYNRCMHECELAKLEEHMRVCGRKSVACPFHELGCQQDKLAAEEMSGHFQQKNLSHSEILIGMIADINREMESRKREFEMLKRNDESNKNEIATLKRRFEDSEIEIEILKRGLVLKDEQIRTIIDQMEHVENENKLIKNEIKSIKEEKADLADRVRILSEKIEQEIDEKLEDHGRDILSVIEHVDRETAAITAVIGSNKDEMDTAIRSLRDEIRSINKDIDSSKSSQQSIQAPAVGPSQIDASCDWTINDVDKMNWYSTYRTSEYFRGVAHPYKYQLATPNDFIRDALRIHLRIYSGASDAQLSWPFSGKVTITVSDRSKREACQTITKQCVISRPADNQYSTSAPFKFWHSSWIRTNLDLCDVHVSCVIVLSNAVDDVIDNALIARK